jgi:hypothetical protein
MIWRIDGPPCPPRDIADRLDRIVRKTRRPTLLVAVKDDCGRTVATVPMEQRRPSGPWDSNGS